MLEVASVIFVESGQREREREKRKEKKKKEKKRGKNTHIQQQQNRGGKKLKKLKKELVLLTVS